MTDQNLSKIIEIIRRNQRAATECSNKGDLYGVIKNLLNGNREIAEYIASCASAERQCDENVVCND